MTKESKLNLVIMPTPVDKGMAGTARLRNFIKFLPKENLQITNLIFSSHTETYDYLGVTIMHLDIENAGMMSRRKLVKEALKDVYDPEAKNILYYYDIPHTPFHVDVMYSAKNSWGYTTVVDVVEDYNTKTLNLGLKGNLRLLFCGFTQKHLSWIADGAIGISGYLVKFLQKHYKNKPIAHLPITFDPGNIIESIEKEDEEALCVFYGGSFGEKDGIEFLVDGFGKAAEKMPTIELHMTGKGSKAAMDELEQYIARSPAPERIINHGFLSYDEYCNVLGRADILCMTRPNSKYANAGFPFKLGEFLAAGKPVIVSRLEGIKEYLSEEDCAFVTPESSEEIGAAIRNLRDKSKRNEIGKRGKQVAFKHFNAQDVAANLYAFLQKI